MTSADSLRQVLLRSSNSVRKASQGKNTIFPVIYPPHLHREFRIAWGFSFFGNLTHSHMPDAVPVRRTNGLPRASFRFHLTMDTLAFGYALGAIPCARDFHPLDCAHAWHTKKSRSRISIRNRLLVLVDGRLSSRREPACGFPWQTSWHARRSRRRTWRGTRCCRSPSCHPRRPSRRP